MMQLSDIHVGLELCVRKVPSRFSAGLTQRGLCAGWASRRGGSERSCGALRGAFTLIELLVVIAIIALLVSILMPSLKGAKDLAAAVTCSTSLRNVNQAMYMYALDNYQENRAPPTLYDNDIDGDGNPDQPVHLGNDRLLDWGPAYENYTCYGDFLINADYCSAEAFDCPSYAAADPVMYGRTYAKLSYGVNMHSYWMFGTYKGTLDPMSYPHAKGPKYLDMLKPGQKYVLGEGNGASSVLHLQNGGYAGGFVRHVNYSANYAFYDGHVEHLTWGQAHGTEWDPSLTLSGNIAAAGLQLGHPGFTWMADYRLPGMNGWYAQESIEYCIAADVFAPNQSP